MRRRFGSGVAVVIALLAAGYSAWWYVLAREVDADFAAWVASRRSAGWTIETGAHHVAGWPFASGIDVADIRLSGGPPEAPVGVTWDGAGVSLRVDPLRPATLTVSARGAQRIGVQGRPALILDGGRLRVLVPIDRQDPPWSADVLAEAVHVRPANGGEPALVGHLTSHVTLDPAAAVTLTLAMTAEGIDLPAGRPWPLGERIAAVGADAVLTGPPPPAGPSVSRTQIWHAAGGSIVLRDGTLRWGPLDGTANATGGLDAASRPEAEGTARVTGWARTLDVLAAHDVISDHAAMTAKAVVSLLAQTPPGGGESVLTLPFTVRDGVLSVGHIPLLRVPVLAWPEE